jgi:hypothetical protein
LDRRPLLDRRTPGELEVSVTALDAETEPETQAGVLGRLRGSRWGKATSYYAALALVTTALAVRAIGLLHHSLNIPLVYWGDALSGGAQFKDVLESGWYQYNPHLGAPWGQQYHDFPQADNLHLMAAHVLGYFTDQWAVAFNLYYLATFPLAALAAAWFMRLIGGSRTSAFAVGILYALAPYHFVRNEGHLYLAAYYPVPLAAGLVYLVLSGRPLWARRPASHPLNPITWFTPRTIWTVLILAIMGTASSYYSVFTVFFLVFAALVALVTTRIWRRVAGAAVATLALMAVMLANMAPNILYSIGQPPNYAAFTRFPRDTESYALKLSSLLLPVPWERIGPLAALRQRYDATFPLPSEMPMLGAVAAVGMIFLIIVIFVSPMLGRRNASDEGGFWSVQRRLAMLGVFGFLVGTVGGFSTLFALLITDSIRGWNRIAIFLSMFALASVGLLFDRTVGWVRHRPGLQRHRWLPAAATAAAAVLVVGVGLFDQVPPVQLAQFTADASTWNSDQRYVDQIQAQVAPNTMIFQLPFVPFPEGPNILNLGASDPLRPYLHSTDLRWSFGGIKGRPLADWADAVSSEPTQRMLVEIGAAKFGGVHIDRAAYTTAADTMLENQLRALLHTTATVSPDGRFSFWNLQNFNAILKQRYSSAQLENIGSHAVAHPVAYWQGDFSPPKVVAGTMRFASLNANPKLYIDNPRSQKTLVDVSFGLTSASAVSSAAIRWPDGYVQTVAIGAGSIELTRRLDLPLGRSAVAFSVATGATPASSTAPGKTNLTAASKPSTFGMSASQPSTFEMSNPQVADLVLKTFPL